MRVFIFYSSILPLSSRLTSEVKGHPVSAVPAGKDISDPINIIKLVLQQPSLPSITPLPFVDPGDSPHPPARPVLEHAPSLI